jgi:RNA polymerase sigma-70 factor (ECF subfamily)
VARSLVGVGGGASLRAASFQDLAEQHLDSSYRLARAILGNSADAEDATHDALVKAWRHWEQLRDDSAFERWFDRILVNTCRNRLRRGRRVKVVDLSSEVAIVTREQHVSGDPMSSVHDRAELQAALARLSPDHRIVVALRFFADLPVE